MGDLKGILLTGATGFLGSHILAALIRQGYLVSVLKRSSSNTFRIAPLEGQFVSYNVDLPGFQLKEVFKQNKIDVVIHTATQYGKKSSFSEILQSNVLWPLTILETGVSFGVEAFINTDSFFTKHNTGYSYLNGYTQSKKFFKEILVQFSDKLKIINLQLEHVYGEFDGEDKFVTNILKKLLMNTGQIELTAGTQRRDFIHVDDVVSAYIQVINKLGNISSFKQFEVGTGKSISVKHFVENLKKVSNSKTELCFGKLPTRIGEFENSFADTNNLEELGWESKISLEEGMIKLISSYKN